MYGVDLTSAKSVYMPQQVTDPEEMINSTGLLSAVVVPTLQGHVENNHREEAPNQFCMCAEGCFYHFPHSLTQMVHFAFHCDMAPLFMFPLSALNSSACRKMLHI